MLQVNGDRGFTEGWLTLPYVLAEALRKMLLRRKIVPLLLFSLCILWPAQTGVAVGKWDDFARTKKVRRQQEQNREWEKDAKKEEADLVKEGDYYYKKKEYRNAARYYRKALRVGRYPQWDIQEVAAGGFRSLEPARRRKWCELKTSYTQRAEDRLRGMVAAIEKERQNEATKYFNERFADASIEMQLGNPAKAYEIYEDVIRLAKKIGLRKKYALDNGRKAKNEQEKILDNAAKPLAEAEKLVEAKKPLDALKKVKQFKDSYWPLIKVAPELKDRLDKLAAVPEIRHELREQAVRDRTALGDAAMARKRYLVAMDHYSVASTMFLETKAAGLAKNKLVQMQNDPKIAEEVKVQKMDRDCNIGILRARTLLKMGEYLEARVACERIIEQYPKSSWAPKADELLKEIAEAEKEAQERLKKTKDAETPTGEPTAETETPAKPAGEPVKEAKEPP